MYSVNESFLGLSRNAENSTSWLMRFPPEFQMDPGFALLPGWSRVKVGGGQNILVQAPPMNCYQCHMNPSVVPVRCL